MRFSIVLASASIVAATRWLLWMGGIALVLTVNGFLLLVDLAFS